MSINIQAAEEYVRRIIPSAIPLCGEINTLGTYLLFDTLTVNNGFTEDVTYYFQCYVAVSTPTRNKGLMYDGLSDVLTQLIQAQQQEQRIELKTAQPFSSNRLIIYQIQIAVTPPLIPRCDEDTL